MKKFNQSESPAKRASYLGAAMSVGMIANTGISYYDSVAGGINEPNQLMTKEGVPSEIMPRPSTNVVIYNEAPVAESVSDEMSFSEAFRAARNEVGAGGVFEWLGRLYNTYYREEWAVMSPDQQQQYEQSVHITEIREIEEEPVDEPSEIILDHAEEEITVRRMEDTRIENGRVIRRTGMEANHKVWTEEIIGEVVDNSHEVDANDIALEQSTHMDGEDC